MSSPMICDRRVECVFKLFAVVYLLAGTVFIVLGEPMFAVLNAVSTMINPALPLIAVPSEWFWRVLVSSLMVTLTFMSWTVGKGCRANRGLWQAILVSKLTSTVFFLLFYGMFSYTLAYLIGAFVDGSIFVVHAWLYVKTFKR